MGGMFLVCGGYRIVGFICEVLICANYARCCRLTEFNSTVTLILSLQLSDLVCVCYSVNCLRMSLYKYFKRVDISASLPDPKGPLSDQIPTASIAEANKEVLKAVAEAKEPQKKGPYIIVTPEYEITCFYD